MSSCLVTSPATGTMFGLGQGLGEGVEAILEEVDGDNTTAFAGDAGCTARPIPEAAPVTITVLPSKRPAEILSRQPIPVTASGSGAAPPFTWPLECFDQSIGCRPGSGQESNQGHIAHQSQSAGVHACLSCDARDDLRTDRVIGHVPMLLSAERTGGVVVIVLLQCS